MQDGGFCLGFLPSSFLFEELKLLDLVREHFVGLGYAFMEIFRNLQIFCQLLLLQVFLPIILVRCGSLNM